MFCPYCGATLDNDALTCHACNAPVKPLMEIPEVQTEQETVPAPALAEESPVPPAPKKKRSRLTGILLSAFGILAVLAAVVALAIYLLPMLAGKGPETALYIKESELLTTRLDKLLPWQVTNKLVDAASTELGSLDKSYYAGSMSDYTYLTEDGRILFYPDKYTPGDDGVTIFYRNIKNHEEAPQRLDSNISQYTISPDGQRVVYLKTDGTLFRFNMTEKVKVAANITIHSASPSFYTSKDCKNLIYTKESANGYTVYGQTEGNKSEVLTSDCTKLHYINDNCNTIYYTNARGNLYKSAIGSDKKKIAYDVANVFAVYESGEIYYSVLDPDQPPTPIPYRQFVEDDVATGIDLGNYDLTNYVNQLCYYDGKETHILAENCMLTRSTARVSASNAPVLVYSCCDFDKVQKVTQSQMDSSVTLIPQSLVVENMSLANKIFVAAKGTVTELPYEGDYLIANSRYIFLTDDGKTGYYLSTTNPDATTGDLYKFAIKDGIPQTPELYDTDVWVGTIEILDNSTILYFCDVSQERITGDLYINQSLVDYNVPIRGYQYVADNQWLLYYTDMDKERIAGTLKLWEDNVTARIAEDVYTFVCIGDEVLYIANYDDDNSCGTLYLYQNDTSEEVDTNVSHIIDSNDTFGFVYRQQN